MNDVKLDVRPNRDQGVDRWFTLTKEEQGLVVEFVRSLGLDPNRTPLDAKVHRSNWSGRTWAIEQHEELDGRLVVRDGRPARRVVVCRYPGRLGRSMRLALRKFGWLR